MGLIAQLVNANALTPSLREQMFALMDEHYDNVQPESFDADLAEKDWVIVVSHPATNTLCGFSTQRLLETIVDGRPVMALYSGDTIVHRDHWGDRALSQQWGRLALQLIDAHPRSELYWWLLSQGYRTYRFLPLFFHEYYPRLNSPTPLRAQAVMDALARERFRSKFDAERGVIPAAPTQYRLRPGIAEVTPERLRDPHIEFFDLRNPGHAHGDELSCLAPLTRENFTAAAYRVIAEGAVELNSP